MATFQAPAAERPAQPAELEIRRIVEEARETKAIVTPEATIELPNGERAVPMATIGPEQRAVIPAQQEVRVLNAETVEQVSQQLGQMMIQDVAYGYDTGTGGNTVTYTALTSATSTTGRMIWKMWNDHHWNNASTAATQTYRIVEETWGDWNRAADLCRHERRQAVWAKWETERESEYQRKYQRTPEEQAARELRMREAAERAEIERKARVAAIEGAVAKSEKLLMSALDDKQKTELRSRGFFHCKSRKGVVYRIYKGTHGNVKRLDREGGKEIESLCIQPDNVPDFDAMLAQKLHIEFNEDDFRKTANIRNLN